MKRSHLSRPDADAEGCRGKTDLPAGNLDNQLCFALYAASRATMATYRTDLAGFGLTYPRYLVMLVLWETDNIPVSTLGERLFLDSGTLSPMLQKLAADKLITRIRSDQDQRIVHIALTKQGRALREGVIGMQSTVACRLGLKPANVDRLRKLLWELLGQLEKTGWYQDQTLQEGDSGRERRPRRVRQRRGRRASSP